MNRSVLIIAFHFPPFAMSSGLQRALKTARYLHEDGWQPVVLTAHPRAYPETTTGQLEELPAKIPVYRAFGLDAMRHFSFRRRYPGFLAWPDPWVSWFPAAVLTGRRLIRRYTPCAIWSTFPISTTNLVAMSLSKWSGLPWVADLRDPMTLEGYPADRMRFRTTRWVERKTVQRASRVVFTAEFTRKIYTERYPGLDRKSLVIPNGYDEANFPVNPVRTNPDQRRLRLVHSGGLQQSGRNPRTLFEAVRTLKKTGAVTHEELEIVLRASGSSAVYRQMTEDYDVSDIVTIADYLPYDEALREMVEADGLMLFQGTIFNHAVPAKLYEYLFARRPIYGIVDKEGETFRVLREIGIHSAASIDKPDEIAQGLRHFLAEIRSQRYQLPDVNLIARYSRRNQVRQLESVLETLTAARH